MQYKKELATAIRAAKTAGKYLMKNFFHPEKNHVGFKGSHEIVTRTDIEADKIIHKIINAAYPDDKILSEELTPKKIKAGRLWLVDPLDGTNNFAHGIPIFAVCVAFALNENLKAGAVYLPYFDEMFWAAENSGAYFKNKKIAVSKTKKLEDSFILQCHGYKPKDKKGDHRIFFPINIKSRSTRRFGAAGYELISVARGNVDGGYIIGTRPWDSAAGALIVLEAGGIVTNFKGKKWAIWDDNILFSNGTIHKELLKIAK